MTDHHDRWIHPLSDEELDGVVDGYWQGPGDARPHPMTDFVTDVRALSDRPAPPPGPALGAYFSADPAPPDWSAIAHPTGEQPVAPAPAPAGYGPPPEPAWPAAQPGPFGEQTQVEWLLPDGNESTGQLPVGDRRSVTLGVDAPPDPYQGPVPGHAGFDDRRPVIATRAPLYEASPLEAVVNLLRPSGTKVFLGFAVLVLAAVSAQALGLVDLPIIGDGSGDQTVAAGDITTTSSVVTTATSSTAVASDPTRFGAGDETTSSSATTAAPTTAAETTASTGATVEEPTSTAATEPEPTEPSGPSSTDSSTSTPDPGSTVEPDPTVTVLPNDTLEPGQSYLVPDDVPAGTYVGQVGPNATCSITIERAGAGIEELTVEGGDRVRVELADGDRVTAGEGCPRLRARQPEE